MELSSSGRRGYLPIEEYRRAFDKACNAVGITGLVPHELRHTTASLAISAALMSRSCRGFLGTRRRAMTLDRYGHLLGDDLAGVADALGKAIESVAVSLRYSGPEYDEAETISAAS
jgi:integrase